jgi:hypothetical protein
MAKNDLSDSPPLEVRILGLVVLGIGLAVAYWAWPTGITETPLGSMTLGMFLWASAAIGCAAFSFWFFVITWSRQD